MPKAASTSLNKKEEAVFRAFPKSQPISISELAAAAFPKKGTSAATKGNSWVRNSLRKLTRLKLVKHVKVDGKGVKSGTYERTGKSLSDASS